MEIVERKEIKNNTAIEAAEVGAKPGFGRRVGGAFKSMFTKKRKVVILASMFVLLCVTGYLNFALNKAPAVGGNVETNTNLFNMFRNTRADERARDIMIYENMVGNSNYSAASQTSAEAKLFEIRNNVAFETAAEGLILAESYADVIVNRSNGFVNVLLKKDSNIDRTQAIKIMSILQSVQPDLDIDNVFISIME